MFLKAVSASRRTYPVVTNGLNLYLDAYNLRSYSGTGTTWFDLSNSGYNLTNNGATWAVSGGRRYFELDGVNDYITGTSNTTLFSVNTVGYTWSIWIYYVTAPALVDSIIEERHNGTTQSYYFDNRNIGATNGSGWSIRTYVPGPAVERGVTFNQTITTGTWQHACATFTYTSPTLGTFRIYLNGSQVVSAVQGLSSSNWQAANVNTYPVIGAFDFNGTLQRFNNIRVGEVLQYNRPLTATEISNNYNNTKINYGL